MNYLLVLSIKAKPIDLIGTTQSLNYPVKTLLRFYKFSAKSYQIIDPLHIPYLSNKNKKGQNEKSAWHLHFASSCSNICIYGFNKGGASAEINKQSIFYPFISLPIKFFPYEN